MNPYENEEEIVETVVNKVEIWLDNGKKKQTFISGLVFTIDVLKEHLKILKKKVAGNGSIQENEENKGHYIIQLQGSHIEIVQKYFTDLGINNIYIRG